MVIGITGAGLATIVGTGVGMVVAIGTILGAGVTATGIRGLLVGISAWLAKLANALAEVGVATLIGRILAASMVLVPTGCAAIVVTGTTGLGVIGAVIRGAEFKVIGVIGRVVTAAVTGVVINDEVLVRLRLPALMSDAAC